MPKLIKKELPPEGAPAYMALYASLMTLLLAFFILLNTLSKQQEAGFKSGMGKIRNAFGLKGGFGLLNYMQMVRGRSQIEVEEEAKPGELAGTPKEITLGKGGSGNLDEKADKMRLNRYLQVVLDFDFPEGSSDLPETLREYLDKVITTFQLFDYAVSIHCVAGDAPSPKENFELANKRALKVLLYLYYRGGIPVNRLRAIGYINSLYLVNQNNDPIPLSKRKQRLVLCIYRSVADWEKQLE